MGGWKATEDPKQMMAVALGIFPRIPEPEFELFCAHRQSWEGRVAQEDRQYPFREGLAKHVGGG